MANRALSKRQAMTIAGVIGALTIVIGGSFALAGFWLTLPFAGLEAAAVWGCFYLTQARLDRQQVIACEARQIVISERNGSRVAQNVMSAAWTRIELRPARVRAEVSRLVLSCHGHQLELGQFLCEQERVEAKIAIDRLLERFSGWAKPASTGAM